MQLTQEYLDTITYKVIGAAIEVHKTFGPGLLESVYHKCMKKELELRGISYKSEMLIPVHYKGLEIVTELRCDLFVENCIVVEFKITEGIMPIHEAQLLTYMNLLGCSKGIIITFNCINIFKEGQKTLITEGYHKLPKSN